jgi:hypothetical protein
VGGEVIEVTPPWKKAKKRHVLSVSSKEEDTMLEKALVELRVSIGAMAGLAKNFMATAQLLGWLVERLEKTVKKRK